MEIKEEGCTKNKISGCHQNRKEFHIKKLRLSLRYRPKIYELILRMRQCIRKKNILLKKFKHFIKKEIESKTSYTQSDAENLKTEVSKNITNNVNISKKDSFTQTKTKDNISGKECKEPAWNVDNCASEKSIAEQVKEVAQSAIQETGMVFVESMGMYYDYKTGYYYNSELGLYYHTDTHCYYYYSDEKKSFVFHSYPDKGAGNVALEAHERRKARKNKKAAKSEDIENLTKQMNQDNEEGSNPKRKKINGNTKEEHVTKNSEEIKITKDSKPDPTVKEDLEDGECSESNDENYEENVSTASDTDDDSVAKHHPPCMRIIVRETSLSKLKVGSLFVITKDGGTVGREGNDHAFLLKDDNVSRNHLEIKYDMNRRMYVAIDLGSKNGTVLNGNRISESQITSTPMEIVHGSTLQLGETKLLCHIHAGNDTCGHCEPGLIMESLEKEKVAYTRTCSVQKQYHLELARLKNKYAPPPLAIEEKEYNDRAKSRRETVGSSHHSEKTEASDVNTYIAPENKGFKLLEKMGWSKGEGLGKDSQGDTEPIPMISNEGKTGLGAASEPVKMVSKTLGPATLRLAARTKMLQPPAKAFQPQDEEESE